MIVLELSEELGETKTKEKHFRSLEVCLREVLSGVFLLHIGRKVLCGLKWLPVLTCDCCVVICSHVYFVFALLYDYPFMKHN